jgi:hypothetical protein
MVPSDYDPDFISGILSKVLDPFLIQNRRNPQDLKNSASTGYFPTYFDSQIASTTQPSLVTGYTKLQQEKIQSEKQDCLCFENILSGRYYHTDHGQDESRHGWEHNFNPFLVGRGDMLRDFRSAYMTRAGLLDPVRSIVSSEKNNHMSYSSSYPSILILPRKSESSTKKKTGTWDHNALVMHLGDCLRRERLPDEVLVLDVERMSMMDQIRQANAAKIMVSMRGGASLLSLFLPNSASIILLDRDEHRFDDMLYDNIPWIHVQEEPILTTRNVTTTKDTIVDVEHVYNLNSICKKIVNSIHSYELSVSSSVRLGQATL